MSDETKRPDDAEQLESLPEKQAEEQVSADDAEAVKGGIIVYGLPTNLSSPTSVVPLEQVSLNYSKIEF